MTAIGELLEEREETVLPSRQSQKISTLPRWITRAGIPITFLVLYVSMLCFGGAHEGTLNAIQLIVFIVGIAAFLPVALQTATARALAPGVCSALCWGIFGWAIIAAIIPLLNPNSMTAPSSARLLEYCRYTLFLAVTFGFLRLSIQGRSQAALRGVIIAGVIAALVSLSHWLSDNGKLFWVFEPEHLFTSTRARWPFVNPDHLAHFLLPSFFLLFAEIRVKTAGALAFARQYEPARKHGFTALFSSRRFQSRLGGLSALLVSFLAVSLAIAGALSRTAWLAVSVGTIAYLAIEFFLAPAAPEVTSRARIAPTAEDPGRRHRRRPKRRQDTGAGRAFQLAGLKLLKPAILLCAIGIFLFFLNERGKELLGQRLEYGLLHTKDDIRWEMYGDTIPVLQEHLITGVGIGNWEPFFRRSMSPLLAGINPVYLHSDPLQFLTETGLLGAAPILCMTLLLSIVALRRISALERDRGQRLTGIIVALWTIGCASMFDFPFRIPALALQAAILLALLASESEDEPIVRAKVLPRSYDNDFEQVEVVSVQ